MDNTKRYYELATSIQKKQPWNYMILIRMS